MRTKNKRLQSPLSRHIEREAGACLTGGLAGAAVGAVAGPPGAIAGAIVGAIVGGLAGAVLDDQAVETAGHDRVLDDAIGVGGGDLGAPNLEHPAPTTGTYSAASSGAEGSAAWSAAEGPIQAP